MILDYIDGYPTEPGWYFINYGQNQVKAVVVYPVQREDGSSALYTDIDILSIPVNSLQVNAWAGPMMLKPIQLDQTDEAQEQVPEPEPVEPELVD